MKEDGIIQIFAFIATLVFLYFVYRYMRFGFRFMWLPGGKKKYKAFVAARNKHMKAEILRRWKS